MNSKYLTMESSATAEPDVSTISTAATDPSARTNTSNTMSRKERASAVSTGFGIPRPSSSTNDATGAAGSASGAFSSALPSGAPVIGSPVASADAASRSDSGSAAGSASRA